MAKKQNILTVFVSSPGNLKEERDAIKGIVNKFNTTWSNYRSVNTRLVLKTWETHTYPSMRFDAQEVINTQIGDDYDIFIGILSDRFGTPTPRADSGTEEEFLRAFSRRNDKNNPVEIMFYFKRIDSSRNDIDMNQLKKVNDFKKRFQNNQYPGMYHEYTNLADFKSDVERHLSLAVQAWVAINDNLLDDQYKQSETFLKRTISYNQFKKMNIDFSSIDIHGTIELMRDTSEADKRVWHLIKYSNDYLLKQFGIVQEIINDTTKFTNLFSNLINKLFNTENNQAFTHTEKEEVISGEITSFTAKLRLHTKEFLEINEFTVNALNDLAMSPNYYSNIHFPKNTTFTLEQLSSYYNGLTDILHGIEQLNRSFHKIAESAKSHNLRRVSRDAISTWKTIDFLFRLSIEQSKEVENIIRTKLKYLDPS